MRNVILAFWLLCSTYVSAQINGRVVSAADGEALRGMIVKAIVAEKTIAFDFTSADGSYVLKIDTLQIGMQLSVAGMGYAAVVQNVTKLGIQPDIRMQTKAFEIAEVSVEAPPVQAVGDTVVYNVSSFATHADQSIEDVLKRMPGIEVQSNGQIRYNGEPINKFYIEGLDLLGGRYAIATRNINPEDIASVSVYENHQPKRVLHNVEPSDKAALNLKLKRNRMLRPIGYTLIGGGYGDYEMKYRGELFVMGIAPQNQFIATGKTNNFGLAYDAETSFLLEDAFDNNTLASNLFPTTPFGTATIPTSRYYANKSGSASVNTIHKVAQDRTLSVSGTYNREHNNYANNIETSYYLTNNDTITIIEDCHSELLTNNADAKIKLEDNADSHYFTNELCLNGRWNENLYSVATDSIISNPLSSKTFGVNNTLNIVIRSNPNIYELKSCVGFATTPRNGFEAASTGSPFVVQNAKGTSFHTINEISTSWIIGRSFILGGRLAVDARYDKFTSENNTSTNDNSGTKFCITAEPFLQLKRNNLTWRTAMPLNAYVVRFADNVTGDKYNRNLFSPDINSSLRFAVGIVKTNITIGRKNAIGGLSDFIVNPIYVTYRRRQSLGNGQMKRQNENFLSLSANFRNAVEGLFGSMRVRLSRTNSNRMAASEVSSTQTQTSAVSADSKRTRLFSMLGLSKNIMSINTVVSIDGNSTFIRQNMMRQGIIINSDSRTFNIASSATGSWINNVLSVRVEGSVMGLNSRSDIAKSSTIFRRALTTDVSLSPIEPLQLSLHAEADKSDVTNGDAQKSFFLDGGIKYVRSKCDVSFIARNILNSNTYSYSMFDDVDTYTYSFALRKTEFMVVAKWSF